MTYPTTLNATTLVVSYLYNHPNWPQYGVAQDPIFVFPTLMPAGMSPNNGNGKKIVLVRRDGGQSPEFAAEMSERFSFWCYAASEEEAEEVTDTLFDVLHNNDTHAVAIASEFGMLVSARKTTGPAYVPEPETGWHRYIVAYQIDFQRYAVTA